MRLTMVNFIIRKKPHGYVFRGKYRLVKKVQLPALREKYEDFMQQEQNMFFLRHPYLTPEQSHGHMAEARKKQEEETGGIKALRMLEREKKFAKTYTWAEQLSHLKVRDAWE